MPGPGWTSSAAVTKKRSRGRRILRWTLGTLGAIIAAAVVGVVVYGQVGVMAAEPDPLAAVRAGDRIAIADDGAGIVLAPAPGEGATGTALVFIPGAKVDPWAYAALLSGLVTDDGLTVVITTPGLNLAFFDLRPLSTPQKIADARHLLPADATMIEIPGASHASHASFGDYGAQPGDGTPTATDAEVRAVVTDQVGELASRLP